MVREQGRHRMDKDAWVGWPPWLVEKTKRCLRQPPMPPCVLSCAQIFATLWTLAYQASLSMGFPRQEYWSELPFPSPGDLSDPGIELTSPASPTLAGRFFTIWATKEAQGAATQDVERLCGIVPNSENKGKERKLKNKEVEHKNVWWKQSLVLRWSIYLSRASVSTLSPEIFITISRSCNQILWSIYAFLVLFCFSFLA